MQVTNINYVVLESLSRSFSLTEVRVPRLHPNSIGPESYKADIPSLSSDTKEIEKDIDNYRIPFEHISYSVLR